MRKKTASTTWDFVFRQVWRFAIVLLTASTATQLAAEATFSTQPPMVSARVVVVEKPGATRSFLAQPPQIPEMVEQGLLRLTARTNVSAAWWSLVSTNDLLGIKVYCAPGDQSGTRPAVVAAVVESLLSAGISTNKIVLWDRSLTHLRLAGFEELARRFNIRLESSLDAGYDGAVFYENSVIGEPVFGDLEFGTKGEGLGRKSFVSNLLTKRLTKIINIAPLLNHNHAGVTGHLYSLSLGSVDNSIRFENSAERLATAVPEIYGFPELADRVILNITDALICQYQGEQRTLVHYSTALNQLWFSKDPVALDTLSLAELDQQRKLADKRAIATPDIELCKNATLLELGVSDTNRISIEKISLGTSF